MKRNFEREKTQIVCGIKIDNRIHRVSMVNFSRMGALVRLPYNTSAGKYISIAYQNEKNEIVQMLTYIVHIFQVKNTYFAGLQFVGIESRSQ